MTESYDMEPSPEHYNECQTCPVCVAFDWGRTIESNDPNNGVDWEWEYVPTEYTLSTFPKALSLLSAVYNERWSWSMEETGGWLFIRGISKN